MTGRPGNRLVALDLPGGPAFVHALTRVWDRGDAAFPVDKRLPATGKTALIDSMSPSAIIDDRGDEHVLPDGRPVEPDDALVVATSGATGDPKGVILTHAAVAASARATSARIGVTDTDHWLACLPLSHVGGLSVVTRALVTGTPLTVLPRFDAGTVASTAGDAGTTLVSLVAMALARLDPSLFRVIVLGGGPSPGDPPPNVVTTYGMTETGSGVVYDGFPLDDVELRIADDGEIHVRGPMLLRAYRSPSDNGPDIDPRTDGWLATGDVGRMLPDGRLHVDGRRVELIITGGENVWPEAVERALMAGPQVADAAVLGTPDPEWGQVVTAYVVPTGADVPTLDDLRRTVTRTLPSYCAPRLLYLVDRIPRTALGKPRRSMLTEAAVPTGTVRSPR